MMPVLRKKYFCYGLQAAAAHPFIQFFKIFLTTSYSKGFSWGEGQYDFLAAEENEAEIFRTCLFGSITRSWLYAEQQFCLLLRQSLISYSEPLLPPSLCQHTSLCECAVNQLRGLIQMGGGEKRLYF